MDDAIEKEIQAKGLPAPRVTPADIEGNIASEHYFTARDGRYGALQRGTHAGPYVSEEEELAPLNVLTFCVLILRNGFTVTGESYCRNPLTPFNPQTGRELARANAVEKLWPLMWYALRNTLHTTA